MSTMSLARRRIEISSLTNPAPTEDDWRRSLPAESGLRASLDKEVWDVRKVDEDYEDAVKVDECDDGHVSGHDESSRSASGSVSHTHTRSPSSSPNSPEQSLPALPSQWAWPRIPNPHPSLLTAVQADAHTGPVRPRREVAARQTPVPLAAQRTRTTAPVPVEGLTKKSRGRRVPTTHAAATDSDIVFQAGKDGDKMTRMFACTVDGCGKCFHRGEHLKRHIRSIHTNERPHSCPEADCLKTFSRHDNLIQHMKTHGRMLPLMLPGASDSQESLDARQPPQTAYRYYPGPMANMPGSRSSPDGASEHPESEAEPESEDEAEHVVHGKLPYKAKSEDEGMDDRLVSDNDPMDVDDQPSHESTPVLGRPKSVQVPLVFQNGLTGAVSGVGTFSPPNGRSRQPSERSIGSPQGELHCPHAPCGKTFRRGEHLRRHIRGIHLAERPHECQHPGCGKTFSRHDNLMQHAKRHARPSDGRKSVARKRTQSAQSATTEGDEPEFESEDEC